MTLTKIQIRWSDIDQLGHVYNGQYQHFFDIAKSDYFEQVVGIGSNWNATGEGLITAQTLNNYYKTIEIEDKVEIETTMEKIGNKSFTLFQRIINTHTQEVVSDSRSVLVGYNPNTEQTFIIPDKWRSKMVADADSNANGQ